MDDSELTLDRVTTGVNVGIFKLEAEWKKGSRDALHELRKRKAHARVQLKKAAARHDKAAIDRWRAQLKLIEDILDRVEISRE